jgi:hypothetical protein
MTMLGFWPKPVASYNITHPLPPPLLLMLLLQALCAHSLSLAYTCRATYLHDVICCYCCCCYCCCCYCCYCRPLFSSIPSIATGPILCLIGAVIFLESIHDIAWSDLTDAVPAFTTIMAMPFTHNIAYGEQIYCIILHCVTCSTQPGCQPQSGANRRLIGAMCAVGQCVDWCIVTKLHCHHGHALADTQ